MYSFKLDMLDKIVSLTSYITTDNHTVMPSTPSTRALKKSASSSAMKPKQISFSNIPNFDDTDKKQPSDDREGETKLEV